VLSGRTEVGYQEVAEHPLIGLDAGSALQRWIETSLGPLAPVVRYRTVVADLNTLVALAAAGVGLAVVPRLAGRPPASKFRDLRPPGRLGTPTSLAVLGLDRAEFARGHSGRSRQHIQRCARDQDRDRRA